jgi:hypothetical protein
LIVVGSALGLSWDGIKDVLGGVNRVLALLALAAALALGIWFWRRARRTRR